MSLISVVSLPFLLRPSLTLFVLAHQIVCPHAGRLALPFDYIISVIQI